MLQLHCEEHHLLQRHELPCQSKRVCPSVQLSGANIPPRDPHVRCSERPWLQIHQQHPDLKERRADAVHQLLLDHLSHLLVHQVITVREERRQKEMPQAEGEIVLLTISRNGHTMLHSYVYCQLLEYQVLTQQRKGPSRWRFEWCICLFCGVLGLCVPSSIDDLCCTCAKKLASQTRL